jgi:uncharacterized protein (TIGR02246 family)
MSARGVEIMTRANVLACIFLVAISSLISLPAAARTRAGDEAAIRNMLTDFTVHWHDSDAQGLAMFWTPDGDFINPDGMYLKGRQQIQGFYAQAFSMGYAGSQATATVEHIRFLKPDLALIDGKFGISGAVSKDRQPLPVEKGYFTAVVKEESGRWWIVSNREMEPPNRTGNRNLTAAARVSTPVLPNAVANKGAAKLPKSHNQS